MTKEEFLSNVTGTHEIPVAPRDTMEKIIIQYSDVPNYEYYAVINGVLVDVSGYEWNDFDEFIEATVEEYKKTRRD